MLSEEFSNRILNSVRDRDVSRLPRLNQLLDFLVEFIGDAHVSVSFDHELVVAVWMWEGYLSNRAQVTHLS